MRTTTRSSTSGRIDDDFDYSANEESKQEEDDHVEQEQGSLDATIHALALIGIDDGLQQQIWQILAAVSVDGDMPTRPNPSSPSRWRRRARCWASTWRC